MSTEREPLLSDADVSKMSVTENGFAGENKYRMGRRIRDYYESLITTGKLRVVEEVESVPTIQGVTMSAKCSGCGLKPLMFNFAYCPGCGNRIKR